MAHTYTPQPKGSERAGQSVATALRAELARQNLNATDLAGRLVPDPGKPHTTIDPRYVRRRILGDIPLTVDDVQWFADALNIPMTDLLAGLPTRSTTAQEL